MPADLIVVPTSRARRYLLANADGIAPKILTIKEFEERIAYVPRRVVIDDVARKLTLKTASERLKNANALGISDDFLSFLDHAPFFLKFFDELAQYGVEPNDLLSGDTYAEYDEHIAVLRELKALYNEELDKSAYADRAFVAEHYALNLNWLKEFDALNVTIEGTPTPFEIKLLAAAADVLPLSVSICPAPYDSALKSALSPLEAVATIRENRLELESDFRLFSLKERAEQAEAIANEVFYYLDLQIAPENIVVVLPDEDFAPMLSRLDKYGLFNFAMGTPFSQSRFYRVIEALLDYDESKAAKAYIERAKIDPNYGDLNDLATLAQSDEEKNVAKQALDELAPIFAARALTPKERLRLFAQTLRSKSIDDNRGGKITVLGALETRAASFEAVIAADFNDDIVPHRSQKDLFLNAVVRARAKLPTYADRADNERSLYWRLFAKARRVTILCVQNDKSEPSRFIKELGIKQDPRAYPIDRAANASGAKRTPNAIQTSSFAQSELSAAKLTRYLTCKRSFYYRYVERLKEDESLEKPSYPKEAGAALHDVLAQVAKEQIAIDDWQEAIAAKLMDKTKSDERLNFEARMWIKRLEPFCQNEKRRFAEGWRLAATELEASASFCGLTLKGRIDRIDTNADRALILDYKSGDLPVFAAHSDDQIDFQLMIYRHLAIAQGYEASGVQAGYYSLKEGKIAYMDFAKYEERFAACIDEFKSPEQSFDLSQSRKPCAYCEYAMLCERAQ
ncbi:MAG: PD-(D/E)XK nuclease family protein [Helicobacteraceae bacterium]|jgi:RecB family exonuclease|nr:PD-(D/E)XK nuclease family protein [Helicobacteraceae bacterium]